MKLAINSIHPVILSLIGICTIVALMVSALLWHDALNIRKRRDRIMLEIEQQQQQQLGEKSNESPDIRQIRISPELYSQFRFSGEMSPEDFSLLIRTLSDDFNLHILSFQPGGNRHSLLTQSSDVSLYASQGVQLQFQAEVRDFLNFLDEIDIGLPEVHIDRMTYRRLGDSERYPLQCELLVSFRELQFADEQWPNKLADAVSPSPNSREHFNRFSASEEELRSFGRPTPVPQVIPSAEVERSEPEQPQVTHATREWEYLGQIRQKNRQLYSVRHIESGIVNVFAIGDEWRTWRLDDAQNDRLMFSQAERQFYLEME